MVVACKAAVALEEVGKVWQYVKADTDSNWEIRRGQ